MALAEHIYQITAIRKGFYFWSSCLLVTWFSML